MPDKDNDLVREMEEMITHLQLVKDRLIRELRRRGSSEEYIGRICNGQ